MSEAWLNTNVVVGTPCFGDYSHEYVASMLTLVADSVRAQIPISWLSLPRCPYITVARNMIAARFLAQPEATHLLWIDADIGFSPQAVGRLLAANVDVIAGAYPLKTLQNPTRFAFKPLEEAQPDSNGVVEVAAAGTGFMLIKRNVLEQMTRAHKELKSPPDPAFPDAKQVAKFYYRLFDTTLDDDFRTVGEDFSFCAKWRKIGGKVFVDTKSQLTHTGTHVFS